LIGKFLFGSRMGDKADWGDYFRHLYDECKEEIEARNRPLEIFTTTGWKNLVFKFAEKSGDKRTKKQLKNKIDALKKDYIFLWSSRILQLDLDGMRLNKLWTARMNGGMNTLL
jgi:hypothetical protein